MIKADFSLNALNELLNAIPQIIADEIIRAFSYLGEQCIARIRDRSGAESWYDQTGNLRSSIGYAIYDHGLVSIESTFKQVGNGSQGANEGRRMIEELASRYAQTYALVVVAGMSYAEYVEAKENKDVLASTDLWARNQVDSYLQKALERAERKITQLQKQYGF